MFVFAQRHNVAKVTIQIRVKSSQNRLDFYSFWTNACNVFNVFCSYRNNFAEQQFCNSSRHYPVTVPINYVFAVRFLLMVLKFKRSPCISFEIQMSFGGKLWQISVICDDMANEFI